MVPGELGSVAPECCRLQRLRELNFSLRTSWQRSMCRQPPFYRLSLLGAIPCTSPFLLFEHFLGSQGVLVGTLAEGGCHTTCQQHARCQNKYLGALGKVMLSSGDKFVGSVCVATSQEKSRSDMQVRSKLPEGAFQINLSDLGN